MSEVEAIMNQQLKEMKKAQAAVVTLSSSHEDGTRKDMEVGIKALGGRM